MNFDETTDLSDLLRSDSVDFSSSTLSDEEAEKLFQSSGYQRRRSAPTQDKKQSWADKLRGK